MNSNISTDSAIKLNEASLSHLGNNVRVPNYDRHQITNGIVHIGVGGFHRAHQALYLDNYFHQNPGSEWGICGIGLLEFCFCEFVISSYTSRYNSCCARRSCI